MSHPLCPLPWSIACGDESLRKINKSSLPKEIIKIGEPSKDILDPKATTIDGMALIRKLNVYDKSFSELASFNSIPPQIFMKYVKKNRKQYVDLLKVTDSLGAAVADDLVVMHGLTGCDTVSAFAGRSKINAFKQLKSNESYQAAYREISRAPTVSTDLFCVLQQITCTLYQTSTPTTSVNKLRYQRFCTKRGECESSSLPPC